MQAHTLQFHILAVQIEACVGVEADVAESERRLYFIYQFSLAVLYLGNEGIECWRLRAPKLRILHEKLGRGRGLGSRRIFRRSCRCCYLLSVLIQNNVRNSAAFIAFHFRFYLYSSVGLSRYEDAVLLYVHLVVHLQPYVAIDSRTRVPARLLLSIYMHHQSVFPTLLI